MKVNGIALKYIAVISVLVLIGVGVIAMYYLLQPPEYNCPPYEEGKIKVIFNENVSEEDAYRIAEEYNCTVVRGDYWRYSEDGHTVYPVDSDVNNTIVRYAAVIEVPEGEEEIYVEKFKENPYVFEASLIRIVC